MERIPLRIPWNQLQVASNHNEGADSENTKGPPITVTEKTKLEYQRCRSLKSYANNITENANKRLHVYNDILIHSSNYNVI